MMIEKMEECPQCGASDHGGFHYDFQRCKCGYDGMSLSPRPTEDALREEVERLTGHLRECQKFLAALSGPRREGEATLNWAARTIELECRVRAALSTKGGSDG